ncbi:nuclear envelope pore membrane protein POM 121-like isoform X2 [Heterocephalus glaber]|uniref:Nuclear envelope pore membrane protein POM 121-like isoform X2 n=1 Tax=Heterocephalus glaber TaxID=10181 RepID=A0AAX6NTX1_HETGA|nr:nuclear envelope pore membrane protein POM 121-like isoform X2 [Heterocephalus glaber]
MGGYLSRARQGPQPLPVRGQDQLERPQSLALPRRDRRVSSAFRVPSRLLSPNLTSRLSCEHPVASPWRRRHRRRLLVVHSQRGPAQKARCLFLGVFPSTPSRGLQKKPARSVSSLRMPCPAAILSLASARGKLRLCLALDPSALTGWTSRTGLFSVSIAKQSRLTALEESSPEKAKEEKDLASPGESGEGFTRQEESSAIPERQADPRRLSEGSESHQSAVRRLEVSGALSSFLPGPGPLKMGFCSGSSVNSLMTESQGCFSSSRSKRNAITSSYSSTQGLPLLLKRGGAGPAGRPHPGPSHFLVPAKKPSEEGHQASSSTSVVSQRKSQHEKGTNAPSSQQQSLRGCSNPSDLSRHPKRKILLLSCTRKDPVILPPPLLLGYRVTAEDLDLEKRAAIQWVNKVLKEDPQVIK